MGKAQCSREHSCQDSHGMGMDLKWAEKYTVPIKCIESPDKKKKKKR